MFRSLSRKSGLWLTALLLLTNSGCTSLGTGWPWGQKGSFAATAGSSSPVLTGEGKGGPGGTVPRNTAGGEESGIQPVGHTTGQGAGASAGQATRPTVVGHPLNLAPGESPAERSLDLSRRLATAEEQNLALTTHAQHLRVQIEQRDTIIASAEKEVRGAAEEVAQARAELQQRKQDLLKLRDRMLAIETENAATLRSVITWLEKVVDGEKKEKLPPRGREPDERDGLLDPIKPAPKK